MLYAIFNPYCLECGASDEKTYVLAHEGKLVHQCTLCGSNNIMWQVDEVSEDDEPAVVDRGKEVVSDEEDLGDGPNHLRCCQCGAEDGYSRIWLMDANKFIIQCTVCGCTIVEGFRSIPTSMIDDSNKV